MSPTIRTCSTCRLFILASIAFPLLVCAASAAVMSGPLFNPVNGHSYYLLEQSFWPDAEAEAISLGGHLVTINDAAEDAFVYGNFAPLVAGPGNRSLLIGLNDIASEGTFVWSSGEPIVYTNWQLGQPNSDASDTDYGGIYVTFGSPSQWHDLIADGRFGDVPFGVVEVVPESGALMLALAAVVSATLLTSKRRTRVHDP